MKIRSQEIILAAVLLGLVVLLGYAYFVTRPTEEETRLTIPSELPGGEKSTPAGDQPRLEVAERDFDFGTIEPDQTVEHTFSIRNAGTGTLDIEGFRTSCGCVTVELSSLEIEPGDAADLVAKLDPQHFGGTLPNIRTYLYTNDPDQHLIWLTVSAEITPEFVVEPQEIDFGTIEKGKSSSRTVRFKQTWREPVKITGLETSSNSIAAFYSEVTTSPEGESVPGGAEYEVEVRLKPDAAGGPLNAHVDIHTNIKRLPFARVPVRAFVTGGIYATPELLFFVARRPTESLGAIDIYGDAPFGLAEIESDLEGVTWEKQTAGSQRRHRIVGRLQPGAQPGERTGSVTVKLRRVSQAPLVVPVAGVVLEENGTG